MNYLCVAIWSLESGLKNPNDCAWWNLNPRSSNLHYETVRLIFIVQEWLMIIITDDAMEVHFSLRLFDIATDNAVIKMCFCWFF